MVLDYLLFTRRGLDDPDVALMLHDDGSVTWGTFDGVKVNEEGKAVPNVSPQGE